MKKYIKNNNGMALPAVLFMMLIMSVLALGLGTYAKSTLERVMYMDTQKQAYYLARAGVETGAYTYQKASAKSNNASDVESASAFNNIDGFVSILKYSNEIVKSDNYIWLVPSSNEGENAGTEWEGLTFEARDPNQGAPANAIGYFTIELVRSQQAVITDAAAGTTENNDCIEIRSTAVCYDDKNATSTSSTKTYVTRGYIFPGETVNTGVFCDSDGNLINDGFDESSWVEDVNDKDKDGDTTDTVYAGAFDFCSNRITIDYQDPKAPVYGYSFGNGFFTDLMNNFVAFFKNMYNGLVKDLFGLITERFVPAKDFYVYGKYSSGDLTLTTPTKDKDGNAVDVDTLKIKNDNMGFYVFSTSGNLNVKPSIDVETTNGNYATVAFYGKDIVIDGDINMAVYYTGTSGIKNGILSNAVDDLNAIFDTLGNRYRLGTVVIGASTKSGGDWYEFLSFGQGGITNKAGDDNIENANRVFFNGNVSVTIYAQGGSTETYRMFNSGDVCLFDGSYILKEGTDANGNLLMNEDGTRDDSQDVRGIDLLKYFLDAVAIGYGDFNLGDTAAGKVKEIRDLYYSGTESYLDKDNDGKVDRNPLRKLKVDYGTDTVTVDGQSLTENWGGNKANGKAVGNYLIPPSQSSSMNINWGKPTISGFDTAS